MRTLQTLLAATCLLAAASASAQQWPGPVSVGLDAGFMREQALPSIRCICSRVEILALHVQVMNRFDGGKGPEQFQLMNEVTIAQSVHPGSRLILGLGIGGRKTFGSGTHRMRPFAEATVGIASYSLRIPETTGRMQYKIAVAIGVKLGKLDFKYGVTHFSNQNTARPNLGINLHMFEVGVRLF